jgi:predicted outer membrane repeat protein
MTIRNAVDDAECRTIIVPAGTFLENLGINRSVTIRGAGPKLTTVDGSGEEDSVIVIGGTYVSPCGSPNVFVTLEGMTITGGKGPPAEEAHRNGGGIGAGPFVDVVVNDCVVTGNSAYGNGGGISVAQGRLTVIDSVISRNRAFGLGLTGEYIGGGGVRVAGCPSELIVVNSVIEQNVSDYRGGGILSMASTLDRGRLIVKDSDIRRNEALATNGGGGVFFDGVLVTWSDSKVKHNEPNDVQDGPPAP